MNAIRNKVHEVSIAWTSGMFEGMIETCRYWHVDRPADLDPNAEFDSYRYRLTDGHVYSHPTRDGCKAMINRHFIEIGVIEIPKDNSHLDDIDSLIWAEAVTNFNKRATDSMPRVGDFVRMPDGSLTRCCMTYDDTHFQTTKALHCSYSMSRCGGASYSGGLDPAQLTDYVKLTDEKQRGRFWFFHHGHAGAHRGVDAFADCRVFELKRFPMSQHRAENHKVYKHKVEFWGAGSPEAKAFLDLLMTGTHGIR